VVVFLNFQESKGLEFFKGDLRKNVSTHKLFILRVRFDTWTNIVLDKTMFTHKRINLRISCFLRLSHDLTRKSKPMLKLYLTLKVQSFA
jgi:hypothetical protein